MPEAGPDTTIGNDCWIGAGATLLPGTQIGDGVIIGAHSVVSGTVPSYSIIAGNPARLVRMRFDPEQIERLRTIAWWDWPIEKILDHEAAICGADVDALSRASAQSPE